MTRNKKQNIKNLDKKNMSNHNDIIVHVARSGSKVIDVCLNGKHSVEDALTAAGLNKKSSEEIRVNGKVVDMDYLLSDNNRVVLAGNVAGGSF